MKRLVVSVLTALAAVLVTAPPAVAHATLSSSNPAEGASLAVAPQQIQLTFSEPVALGDNAISVIGPDGTAWTVGKVALAGAVVTAPVQPAGPAGKYTLTYRVVADDGDPQTGTVQFTLTAPAVPSTTISPQPASSSATATVAPQPTSAPQADQADDGGLPVWVWILGAVVLAAIAAVFAMRTGRSRS